MSDADCRVLLEAAQREIVDWKHGAQHEAEEADRLRATEAELRAQITEVMAQNERFDKRYRDAEAVVEAAKDFEIGYWSDVTAEGICRKRLFAALAALETAAPTSQDAQNGPFTGPSAHGSAENDHSAMGTTDGPQGANP